VRLLCHSDQRAAKETAMTTLQRQRFEAGLDKLVASLSKPQARLTVDTIHQRIGRLKQAYASVAQHYQIEVTETPSIAATPKAEAEAESKAKSESKAEAEAESKAESKAEFKAESKAESKAEAKSKAKAKAKAKATQTVITIRWSFDPTAHSKAALAGHYVIRSNDLSLSAEDLWRHYIQLTELEAVFRSLKSELGLRPIHHQLESRCKAHLWISVLAYQCVMFLRRTLKAHGIQDSWQSIRTKMERQCRITASFAAKAGGTLHIRKTSQPEPEAKAIYAALGLDNKPGAIRRRHFRSEYDL